MAEEQVRVSMNFKFMPRIKELLERLAGLDDRSMTNYLERLIEEDACSKKLLPKNNCKKSSK